MPYAISKLQFTTGMHIGMDASGNTLSSSQQMIHADTIFSALCCICSNEDEIERLYQAFKERDLCISDALPFRDGRYYIPRPIDIKLVTANKDEIDYKALKKAGFIPVPSGNEGLRIDQEAVFGEESVITRAKMPRNDDGDTTPYHVSVWQFAKDAGLYVVIEYKQHEMLTWLQEKITILGMSGVGGKISSGLGKFSAGHNNPVPQMMQKMLDAHDAQHQVLLGTALPADDELSSVLEESSYQLIRRGGYVYSPHYAKSQVRKNTLYLLTPGSCFPRRFMGTIRDIGGHGNHPIWRLADSLFLGVTAL